MTITLTELHEAAAITLSAAGKSDYVIVVADGAIAPEQTAAKELQTHLQAVTGTLLPIQDEKDTPSSAKQIVVGPSKRLHAAFPAVNLASLQHDGIVMKTAGDTLYLVGGRPRGTLYAVYTFLEGVVGCRWWSSSESFTPKKPALAVPDLEVVYVPKLRYREAFYRDAFDGVFAARSKCNGHFEKIPAEYGGHYSILGWCHTFYQLLPAEKYFKDHPEWYSDLGGKRVGDGAQLCLTNTAMRDELIKNALEWIRKDPDAGIISIAQNDCGGNCQCAQCAAIEKEEGAPSGLLIRFVNSVAEAIEKEFPDVLVETLAYQYTRQAPNLAKPRKNVIVRLCSIECCFSEPLGTGPQNAEFKRDIEAWSAIAPQLYIWDYVTNFGNYILPHPNLRVLAPNIRFFVDHKAIGLFEQGDAGSTCSDFPELRAWLLAHLMWDPSRDEKALVAEFLQGYYGPAAKPLQQYLDVMCDAVERSGACLRCGMADTSAWCGLEDLNRGTQLFDEAQRAVADDPILAKRVRRARLALDHAWLNRYGALKRFAKAKGVAFLGPQDPVAFCEEFIRTCNAFNVGQYAEGRPFKDYEPILRSRFHAAGPPPKECAGLSEDAWIDIQDNEFRLAGVGEWTALADDPNASDGRAARMPATHNQWAVQYPVSADVAALGPVHCYVVARCDAKAKSGPAFQIGIYDSKARGSVAQQVTPLEQVGDGAYRTFDLGVHAVTSDMYVWVAPMKNPDAVDVVWVDRIFFIRQK